MRKAPKKNQALQCYNSTVANRLKESPLHLEFMDALNGLPNNEESHKKMVKAVSTFYTEYDKREYAKVFEMPRKITGEGLKNQLVILHLCALQIQSIIAIAQQSITQTLHYKLYMEIHDNAIMCQQIVNRTSNDENVRSHLFQLISPCTYVYLGAIINALNPGFILRWLGKLIFNERHRVELKTAVLNLNAYIYSPHLTRQPFTRLVSRLDGDIIVCPEGASRWEECLVAAGVPPSLLEKYMLICFQHSFTLRFDDSPTEATIEQEVNAVFELFPAHIKYKLCIQAASCNFNDALKYFIRQGWLEGQEFKFFTEIFSMPVVKIEGIAETLLSFQSVDVWSKDGYRPLHAAIMSDNSVKNIKILLILGADLSHHERDRINLVKLALSLNKLDIAAMLKSMRSHMKVLNNLKRVIITDWIHDNPDDYLMANAGFIRDCYDEKSILQIILKCKTAEQLHRLKLAFKDRNLPYIDESIGNPSRFSLSLDGDILDRRVKQLGIGCVFAELSTPKVKKPKNKIPEAVPLEIKELPDAAIETVPSSGGSNSKPKAKVEEAKFEVKFTDIDRNDVYVKLLEAKFHRLNGQIQCHNIKTIESNSHLGGTPVKLTLKSFKIKAKEGLDFYYTEDIACIAYAQQYFDPKLATAFEKSKCLGHYNEHKTRRNSIDEQMGTTINTSSSDENLVELVNVYKVPKVIGLRRAKRPTSINLESAKHELLFLRGLWSWRSDLLKSEKLQLCIFEDCLRVSSIRFYNSIFNYHWERKAADDVNNSMMESVTVDDFEAGRLRNVIVHNFPPVADLEIEAERRIFSLEARLMQLCHNQKAGPATISLKSSSFHSMKVLQLNSRVDSSRCRDKIIELLSRLKTYVKILDSKQQDLSQYSALLTSLDQNWESIAPALRIWVYPARAIESCLVQIGELSSGVDSFDDRELSRYVQLCRQVRHISYHDNNSDEDWNFDPLSPEFIASMIQGCP